MKLIGALLTEVVNIFLICSQNNIMDCVMNFIALGVIAEIDNLYASSLKEFKCKAVLEEENIPEQTKGGLQDFKNTFWLILQRC